MSSRWFRYRLLYLSISVQVLINGQKFTTFIEQSDSNPAVANSTWSLDFGPLTIIPLKNDDIVNNTNAACGALVSGSRIWLGICSPETCSHLSAYSQAMHIPLVLTSPYQPMISAENATQRRIYQLIIHPPTMPAVMEIISNLYNWTQAPYVTNSAKKRDQSEQAYHHQIMLQTARGNGGLHMNFVMLQSAAEAVNYITITVLRRPVQEWHIVLDMPAMLASKIMILLLRHDRVRERQFHFVLASLDHEAVDFDVLRFSSNSLTTLSMMNGSFQVSPAEPTTTEEALIGDAVSMLHSVLNGLTASFDNESLDCFATPSRVWKDGDAVQQRLLNAGYIGLTGKIEFNAQGIRKNYKLHIMESLNGRRLSKRGTWSDTNGIHLPNENQPDGSRILRAVGVLTDRFLVIKPCKDSAGTRTMEVPHTANPRKCYSGYIVDLIHELRNITGCTFVLHNSEGRFLYGNYINGSWTGAIGELLRKNADIIIADLGLIAEREAIMEFAIPYMNDGFVVLLKKEEHRQLAFFAFMQPFSPYLWLSLALALLITFVVVFFVGRVSSSEWHPSTDYHHITGNRLRNDYTMVESLWLMIATLLQQGPDISPRSCATKIAVGAWYVWALIIVSTYTANLAAYLTLNRMTSSIQSVEDLAAQDEVRYGILAGSAYSNTFFNNSKEELYQRMWSMMKRHETAVDSLDEGIQKVRHGKFAFIGPKTVVDYANSGSPCDTRIVGQPLYYSNYALALPAGSPLRKHFSEAILQLNENGVLRMLERRWFRRDDCANKKTRNADVSQDDDHLSALSPYELAGLFIILAAGLLLSMIVAIADYLCNGHGRLRKYRISIDDILLTAPKHAINTRAAGNPEDGAISMVSLSQQNSWTEMQRNDTLESLT